MRIISSCPRKENKNLSKKLKIFLIDWKLDEEEVDKFLVIKG